MNPKITRGRTRNGGILTKVFYMDDDHNKANEDDATKIIAEEYDKDGIMVMRTHLTPSKNDE